MSGGQGNAGPGNAGDNTSWLGDVVVPLAWCWRIVRNDGVMLGLTTHDAPLVIDDLVYAPSPGIRPSAIEQRRGLDGDSVEIDGALTSDAITAADLDQGRWNGAQVTVVVADWQAPDARHIIIAAGTLGEVSTDGIGFTAALNGRDPRLDTGFVPETSAECRAELGDAQCRAAMAGRVVRAIVTAVSGDDVVVAGSAIGSGGGGMTIAGDGRFAYGRIRWLSGAARGLSASVVAHAGNRLTLNAMPDSAIFGGAVAVGDHVELREGCDKRAATCAARFANIANFRGEPHLPGMDLLTRFPGG